MLWWGWEKTINDKRNWMRLLLIGCLKKWSTIPTIPQISLSIQDIKEPCTTIHLSISANCTISEQFTCCQYLLTIMWNWNSRHRYWWWLYLCTYVFISKWLLVWTHTLSPTCLAQKTLKKTQKLFLALILNFNCAFTFTMKALMTDSHYLIYWRVLNIKPENILPSAGKKSKCSTTTTIYFSLFPLGTWKNSTIKLQDFTLLLLCFLLQQSFSNSSQF